MGGGLWEKNFLKKEKDLCSAQTLTKTNFQIRKRIKLSPKLILKSETEPKLILESKSDKLSPKKVRQLKLPHSLHVYKDKHLKNEPSSRQQ